jgi:energy-coupling factor transporter ATP-binding protein EcfA2
MKIYGNILSSKNWSTNNICDFLKSLEFELNNLDSIELLTIINSKVYGKAEIRFNDCDSLQLVGPNNIGKSTLIYALNFLFIIDGNKMTFSGNRRGDKETIHHYFPNPNQSYIVFEVFKKAYYCILLKLNMNLHLPTTF